MHAGTSTLLLAPAPNANRLVNVSIFRSRPVWTEQEPQTGITAASVGLISCCWSWGKNDGDVCPGTPLPVNPEGNMLRSHLVSQAPKHLIQIETLFGCERFSKLQQRDRRTTASRDLLMAPGNDLTPPSSLPQREPRLNLNFDSPLPGWRCKGS